MSEQVHPDRNERIVALRNQGFNNTEIGRKLGMPTTRATASVIAGVLKRERDRLAREQERAARDG